MASDEEASIEREIRRKAEKRVHAKVGFYWHFMVFVMTMAAVVAINLHYTPQRLWFVWPLCGWGAGLLMHAFATFQARGMTEDMVQAEIRRERARRQLG
jgi:hypothetical protein